MKPVVIFRHALTEGAGYLSSFLHQHGIPTELVKIDQQDPMPTSAQEFAGLVFMGGPMSVNDELPWIPKALALIQEAVAHDIPVLGHCLGGQLISKALGAEVTLNPVKEIGWGRVNVSKGDTAEKWFGDATAFDCFHWHGETFSLPNGAEHMLASSHCANQAYAIGPHLALQCHIEMTASMVQKWCEVGMEEVHASSASPGVQSVEQMQEGLEAKVHALNQIAHIAYSQWIKGLKQA